MGLAGKSARSDEELTARDYEQLASFRHVLRRFLGFSAGAAHEAGLTSNQHQALLSIKAASRHGLFSVGQLAEHLLVAPHTAAELAARLETDGMLHKIPDTEDRRRVGLELTAKAEQALHALTNIHLEEIRVIAPGLIAALESLLPPDAVVRGR